MAEEDKDQGNKRKGEEQKHTEKGRKRGREFDKEIDERQKADNPGLIEFPHTVGGALIKPEDEGKIKSRALSAMKQQTDRQLNQLYEQVQVMVNQANEIKQRAEVSERIYMADMSFEPIIAHTYYLYERSNGKDTLSMIGPDEWGNSMPFKRYVARVTLLSDHTWDIEEYHGNEEENDTTHNNNENGEDNTVEI